MQQLMPRTEQDAEEQAWFHQAPRGRYHHRRRRECLEEGAGELPALSAGLEPLLTLTFRSGKGKDASFARLCCNTTETLRCTDVCARGETKAAQPRAVIGSYPLLKSAPKLNFVRLSCSRFNLLVALFAVNRHGEPAATGARRDGFLQCT